MTRDLQESLHDPIWPLASDFDAQFLLEALVHPMSRDNTKFSTRDHFEVGSQPPSNYVGWHLWAEDQHKGGLRQTQCKVCGLWKFPQEACKHVPQTAEQQQE